MTVERTAICKPRTDASGGTEMPIPWPWFFAPQEVLNFCCLSHPIPSILRWKTWKMGWLRRWNFQSSTRSIRKILQFPKPQIEAFRKGVFTETEKQRLTFNYKYSKSHSVNNIHSPGKIAPNEPNTQWNCIMQKPGRASVCLQVNKL